MHCAGVALEGVGAMELPCADLAAVFRLDAAVEFLMVGQRIGLFVSFTAANAFVVLAYFLGVLGVPSFP